LLGRAIDAGVPFGMSRGVDGGFTARYDDALQTMRDVFL
jgi:hypothetical protein